MKVVLDASAALEIALNRKHAAALAQIVDASDTTLAPDLYVPEVVNAIWKEHHFGGYSLAGCEEALAILLDLVDILVPSSEFFHEAFVMSRAARRPAYDMFYLALARREDAILVTLDAKLRKEASRQGVRISS